MRPTPIITIEERLKKTDENGGEENCNMLEKEDLRLCGKACYDGKDTFCAEPSPKSVLDTSHFPLHPSLKYHFTPKNEVRAVTSLTKMKESVSKKRISSSQSKNEIKEKHLTASKLTTHDETAVKNTPIIPVPREARNEKSCRNIASSLNASSVEKAQSILEKEIELDPNQEYRKTTDDENNSTTSELTDDGESTLRSVPKSITTKIQTDFFLRNFEPPSDLDVMPLFVDGKAAAETNLSSSSSGISDSQRSCAEIHSAVLSSDSNSCDSSTCAGNSSSSESTRAESSSSSSSSSVDSSKSTTSATFSTLLSSESSCISSVLSGVSRDTLCNYSKTLDDDELSNISLESLKIRKRNEERSKALRRISAGDRHYRIYLSRQEELVQNKARYRIQQRRRLCAMRKLSTLAAIKVATQEVNAGEHEFQEAASSRPSIGGDTTCRIIHPTERKADLNSYSKVTTKSFSKKKLDGNSGVIINDSALPPIPREPRRESLALSVKRALLFEKYHSVPGLFAMSMYCIAHISFYELFYGMHYSLFNSSSNPNTVNTLTLLLGLLIMRLSGAVWNWLNETLYEAAKFDMHNKLRLGHLDARILRWVRKHGSVKTAMDICGVYLCFIAVGYFLHEVLMPSVCDMREELLEELPSAAYPDIPTYTKSFFENEEIEGATADVQSKLWECLLAQQCCDDLGLPEEDLKTALEAADEEYLYSKLSPNSFFNLVGWEGTPLISGQCQVVFNAVNALCSMAILFKIGVGFWDD